MPSRVLGLGQWLLAAVLALPVAVAPVGTAHAQATAEVERPALPRGRFELGYALSFRQDSQTADQVDVAADGLAPSHLRADAAVFFGDLPLGLAARFGWERFALQGENLQGERVSLNAIALDAGGGLAVRLDLRGWALEADLGYAWHRLPIVDSSVPALRSGAIQSHGPLLALRFGKPTGWFQPEVHASTLPYVMGETPLGSSSGWRLDAGVGLGFGGLPLGGVEWTAVLGYDYGTEQLDGEGGRFVQGAHRVGVGLRVAFPGPARPASGPGPVPLADPLSPGTLRGVLLDPDGAPVPGRPVSVVRADQPDSIVQTAEDGRFSLAGLAPGSVKLTAVAEKLKPAQAQVEVPPGGEVAVELRFARPTGPGSIRGVVFEKSADPASRAGVPGARIEAPGLPVVETDASGAFQLAAVPPGLVPLKVSAKGFVQGEEVVSVAAEAESRVELFLVAEKARPLATLRGVVRAVGGKPLAARLTVPEAKVQATASAKGEFQVKVPGGRYKVRIEARGYVPQTKTVEVADGDQAIFNIDMHPAK